MSSFAELRAQLGATRAERAASQSQLTAAREQLRDVRARIAALHRISGEEQRRELEALERQEASLSTAVDRLRRVLGGLRADADRLLGDLADLDDPSRQIAELSDSLPILLFPVRLETRFRTAVSGGGTDAAPESPPQLCIRIYPDDCQVDSFEELLTQTEVDNARSFWIELWRAGKVEAQERGAWRALVAGSGSGRAAYVVEQYRPASVDDRPAKVEPQDVVLVILPDLDVTPAEEAAALAYHTAVWRADGDAAQEAAALAALRAAVGSARADAIRERFAPDPNGLEPPEPYTRADVRVRCSVLRLSPPPQTKTTAWTQAPTAYALPDRFVALLWSGGVEVKRAVGNAIPDGLAVGPDPSLPPEEQITRDGDDLVLNEDLRWLADFERAVEVGMGIVIDLTPAEAAAGFDRLLLLGLRLSSDEYEARQELETLIAHHAASRHGFSLVPQGSPTNNTEAGGSAYTWVDDADAGYDVVFKGVSAYGPSDDPLERRDGEWLAEALGVDDGLLRRLPNAGGSDQREARAMQVALWPATMGYWLEEMLTPLVSPAEIAATRSFFARYVSGRGPLPSVRVGKQPYGILVATAFSRYRAADASPGLLAFEPGSAYLGRLHGLLARLDADWRALAESVAHVGQPGDPAQTLLDVLGLHAGSVEYHQRYAESFDQLYNKLVIQFGHFLGSLLAAWLRNRGRELLTQIGADPEAEPPLLEKFFYGESPLLDGPVVDDAPLSETAPIRAYTPDGKNYVEWLATSSLETIRMQDFGGNPAPTALLFLLLRHGRLLGHWDAGMRFLETRALADTAVLRREPSFVHVATDGATELSGASKFQHLYEPKPEVTGDETTTLGEYVQLPSVLAGAPETVDLRELIAALEVLQGAPTARLERDFAEHVDCVSYRLDAWKTGLAASRLEELRRRTEDRRGRGIYLGAYGWLENVRPKSDRLTPVQLEPELAAVFQRPEDAPLRQDPGNAGHIHAPSLNQAAAAAVLKNAHRVHATASTPDAMAVDLSSGRVRRALALLEGVRNGQPLGALLGYRFERDLHDRHDLAEVDKFIYPLRQAFPLVANQLKSTQPDDETDITLVEARNVLDGLALVTRISSPATASYPFGLPIGPDPGQVPAATPEEQAAIDAAAAALLELYDAVADLVLAESVYQVVLGNFDRAAATTKAFGTGGHPPETHVVDTPRSGMTQTHRVALHLDSDADPAISPSSVPMTPRARAEAPLNGWLADRLPDPQDVVVQVTYDTPVLAAPQTITISQEDLQLQPVDLLHVADLEPDQAMTELDDRIVQAVRYGPDAHPDVAVTIGYTEPVAGKVTFFELASLLRSLRTLLLQSRPLTPTDLAPPLEGRPEEALQDADELAARVDAAITRLTPRRDALVALETDTSDLDEYARKVTGAFLRTALNGIPGTGTGEVHATIRAIYDAVANKLRAFIARWDDKRADYLALIARWPSLTTDEERFALLREAEGLIAASTTAEPPASANAYKLQVEATKTQFDGRLTQLRNLLGFATNELADFVAAAGALAPQLSQHDAAPLDLADQQAAVTALRETLVARVVAVAADLTERIDAARAALTAAALPSPQARVERLLEAARLVLGEDVVLVPRFELPAERGLELEQCWNGSAALLADLHAAGRRFPVDDWLYGVARVREKLAEWENAAVLCEAFGAGRADLTPLQLPFISGDRWTALEFDTASPALDRLLYTAHFATPFDRTAVQCGLLLDEWPELVPGPELVSGVTFHFDRPSSQPPQALLLAVPPALTGAWSWDDLVATLNETLDAARARAVEPAHVDASSYAQFLPATLMAVTLYQITIATNLAQNIGIYERIAT